MKNLSLRHEHQRIYERWHELIKAKDLDGLMKLYADDAVLDSALMSH